MTMLAHFIHLTDLSIH